MPEQSNIISTENLPVQADTESSIQIGDSSTTLECDRFAPFEKEIQCPNCEHHMLMWMQPMHNHLEIACPACLQPLAYVIRREIREYLKNP